MVDFLSLDDVLAIHADQVQRYGGSDGVRDLHLLQSAVAMPSATFDACYLHNDIYAMAAAYLFHITQNHPFVDGNKRTGAVAALVFLEMNGVQFDAPEDDLEDLVRQVATGQADKEAAAAFLRRYDQV